MCSRVAAVTKCLVLAAGHTYSRRAKPKTLIFSHLPTFKSSPAPYVVNQHVKRRQVEACTHPTDDDLQAFNSTYSTSYLSIYLSFLLRCCMGPVYKTRSIRYTSNPGDYTKCYITQIIRLPLGERDLSNPFSTAVPFWGQTTPNLSGLPPKGDCSPERFDTGRSHRSGNLSRGTIVNINRTYCTHKNLRTRYRFPYFYYQYLVLFTMVPRNGCSEGPRAVD